MKLDLYDTYGKRFIVQLEYYSHIDKAAIFLSYISNRKKKVDAIVPLKHRSLINVQRISLLENI